MTAEWVRRIYGVNYKRGDRVVVDGRAGTIVSFPDQYLGVRFEACTRVARCHPTWRVVPEPHEFESSADSAEICRCGVPKVTHAAIMHNRAAEIERHRALARKPLKKPARR